MSVKGSKTPGVKRFRLKFKETVATILAENEEVFKKASSLMLYAREKIEEKIALDPFFLITYEPYDCTGEVVERMCRASKIAGVGPMAAVAGTIAGYAVEKLSDEVDFLVIDNGGDIALKIDRELTVGIYSGKEVGLAFKVEPRDGAFAICTSSGKIGHSVSFGYADAATIIAEDGSLADAFATALGNMIAEEDGKKEVEEKLEEFWKKARKYVEGALVVKDEVVAFVGEIPELVKAKIDPDVITKG